MRGKIAKYTVFAGFLIMLPVAVLAQDLVNGDFELPGGKGAVPSGWTVTQGTFVQDDMMRKSRQYSGRMNGNPGASSIYQDVTVTPGATYSLTGWWRNGDRTADFDVVKAEIRWLTTVGGADVGAAGSANSGSVVGDWMNFTIDSMTAPSNARGARIAFKSTNGIGALDNLVWRVSGSASVVMPPAQAAGASPASSAGMSAMVKIPDSSWQTDLAAGQQLAAAQQKRILVYFSAPAGEASQYFEQEVFPKASVKAALSRYVPVILDFGRNAELAYKLQVFKAATFMVYDSKGTFLGKIEGKPSAEEFISKLNAL